MPSLRFEPGSQRGSRPRAWVAPIMVVAVQAGAPQSSLGSRVLDTRRVAPDIQRHPRPPPSNIQTQRVASNITTPNLPFQSRTFNSTDPTIMIGQLRARMAVAPMVVMATRARLKRPFLGCAPRALCRSVILLLSSVFVRDSAIAKPGFHRSDSAGAAFRLPPLGHATRRPGRSR